LFKEHPQVRDKPARPRTETATPLAIAPLPPAPVGRTKSLAPAPLAPEPATHAATSQWDSDRSNGLRKLTFYFALAVIYIRFSELHEIFTYHTGSNSYILYLLSPPALLGILLFGGIRRVFSERMLKSRLAYYWIGFVFWLALSVPFSSWRGGSTATLLMYLKTEITMLFIVGALVMGWKECRAALCAIALGGATFLFASRGMTETLDQRMGLTALTVANPNDFAAHLVVVSAFLLYVASSTKMNKIFRGAAVACLVYAVYTILGTASRGAFLALLVMSIFTIVRASPQARIATLALAPIVGLGTFAFLPEQTRTRLLTLSGSGGSLEAQASSEMRKYELETSLKLSVTHPLFGVGPAQFSTVEGTASRAEGQLGVWHETHNAYTQISSECGIPALIFFLAALGSTFSLLNRIYRFAKARAGGEDIARAAFCTMLALVGIAFSIFFLSQAYRFYYPALGGLALALADAAERQLGPLVSGSASNRSAVPVIGGDRSALAIR
jgi:O-antigen ligase